jgi:uncharacterized protein (TIGR02466 family)
MFADAKIVNLFPTAIWAHTLTPEDAETVSRKTLDAIETLKAESPARASDEAWQTERKLHTQPEFLVIAGLIKDAVEGVLGKLQAEAGNVTIDGLWATVVPPGATGSASGGASGDEKAANRAASLSGVYLAAAPGGSDGVTFDDPKPGLNLEGATAVQPNAYTARNASLALQAGTLLVFPAWLAHGVSPGTAEGERITLSFDITLG